MNRSSGIRLVVVMDPIESIKPAKDSTLAILLAAQARGWQLFYAEQKDLWLRDGVAWGRLSRLQVFDDRERWFEREPPQSAELGGFDVILMRKDPPFDTEYIYTTYILDRAQGQGALVCNGPQGLRDMHDMSDFLREHGKAVCKPLDGMGGKSIFVLEQGDKNRNVIFESLTGYGTRYAIVQ